MKNEIRWGILGPGKIAHKFALALAGVEGARLQAVGSRDIERARAFAETYSAPSAHGTYEQLAADPEVDVIYIATPHPAHGENMLLCLEHDKPVLCEKPFTMNAAEAQKAVDLARAKKLFLMEAMWTRFLPAIRTVRDWLAEGAIGEVRMLSAAFGFRGKFNPEGRLFNPSLGGGALLDVGVYPISFASMVLGGAPQSIAAVANMGETHIDEEAGMLFHYPGGKIAALQTAIRLIIPGEARIMGTEGWIHLPLFWRATQAVMKRGEQEERIDLPYAVNGFEYQIEETCRCLREGRAESPLMPLDETVEIMRTLDRIRAIWGLTYPADDNNEAPSQGK